MTGFSKVDIGEISMKLSVLTSCFPLKFHQMHGHSKNPVPTLVYVIALQAIGLQRVKHN